MSHSEEDTEKIITISIATIYNVYCNENRGESNELFNILYLKPIVLSGTDFFSMFYSTNSRKFCINKIHKNDDAIVLSKQIVSSDNAYFSINELLASCNLDARSTDSMALFELQKEVKRIDSMANINGTSTSLSWEQVSSVIDYKGVGVGVGGGVGGNSNPDLILFQIRLVYLSTVLQQEFNIIFQYVVKMDEIAQYLEREMDDLVRCKNKYTEKKRDTIFLKRTFEKPMVVVVENPTPIQEIKFEKESSKRKVSGMQENMNAIKNRPSILSERKRMQKPEVVHKINIQLNNHESNINIIDELTKLNKTVLPISSTFSNKSQPTMQMRSQPRPIPRPIQQPMPRPIQQPIPRPIQQPMPRPIQQPIPRPIQQPIPRPIQQPIQQKPIPRIDSREKKMQQYYEKILNSVDKFDNTVEYDDYDDYNEYNEYNEYND